MKFSTNSRLANLSSAATVLPGDYGDGVKGLMNVQVGWKRMQSAMITEAPTMWLPSLTCKHIDRDDDSVVDDYHDYQVGSQPASDGSLSSSSWSPRWPLQQGKVQSHHDDDSNKVTLQGIMMMAYRPLNIIVIIIIQ